MTTDQVFDIVMNVRQCSQIPICLMTYLNPVFHYQYDKFFQKCQEVGVDGIIIPDCPYEESQEVKKIAKVYGITVISMIAPTSQDRIKMIAKEAEGFIYLVSSMGVTGVRQDIHTDVSKIVHDIKTVTDIPVAIGFGIHSPDQAQEMRKYADGVIVGSAIVKIIAQYGEHAHNALYEYVKSMLI